MEPSKYSVAAGEFIRQLLFEVSPPGLATSLAESAAKLADWVGEYGSGQITSGSVKTGISAVVGARRSASDELVQEVLNYARHKLRDTNPADREKYVAKIEFAFDQLRERLMEDDLKELGIESAFNKVSGTSSVKFLIPPGYLPTGSNNRSDPRHEDVRIATTKLLLDRVGALRNTIDSGGPKYILCFADRTLAGQIWRNMFQMLVSSTPPDNNPDWHPYSLERALELLNSIEDKSIITTYAVDKYYCLSPVMIFDHDKAETAGYHIYYDGGALITSYIPDMYLQTWKRFITDLTSGSYTDSRVYFAEFVDFLTQEYRLLMG